LPYGVWSA